MKNRPTKLTDHEVSEWVNRKLSELRAMSYEEHRSLPSWQAENPRDERFRVQGVYRDAMDDGRLRIVVQAIWSSRAWADGFWMSPRGEPEILTPKELWEFT